MKRHARRGDAREMKRHARRGDAREMSVMRVAATRAK
jgi:hypothetical protein